MILKWVKNLNRHFFKKNTNTQKKHMTANICSQQQKANQI